MPLPLLPALSLVYSSASYSLPVSLSPSAPVHPIILTHRSPVLCSRVLSTEWPPPGYASTAYWACCHLYLSPPPPFPVFSSLTSSLFCDSLLLLLLLPLPTLLHICPCSSFFRSSSCPSCSTSCSCSDSSSCFCFRSGRCSCSFRRCCNSTLFIFHLPPSTSLFPSPPPPCS